MDSEKMIEMIADIIYDERFEKDVSMTWKAAKKIAILIVEKMEQENLLR